MRFCFCFLLRTEKYGCKTFLGTNTNKENKQSAEIEVWGEGVGRGKETVLRLFRVETSPTGAAAEERGEHGGGYV